MLRSDEPTGSPSKLPLREFNSHLKRLGEILRRNGRDVAFDALSEGDRLQLRECIRLLEFFLCKVCKHETRDQQISAAAVMQTRHDLLDRLEQEDRSSFLKGFAAVVTNALMPRNVWLYLRAKNNVLKLESDEGKLISSLKDFGRGLLADGKEDSDAAWAKFAADHCPLRTLRSLGRRGRTWELGIARDVNGLTHDTYCRRACDLLLLLEVCFTCSQMAKVFGISASTASDQLKGTSKNPCLSRLITSIG